MGVIVVGGGSIGKRHLGNLRSLGVGRILAVDPREDRRQEVTERFGAQCFASLDDAPLDGLDAGLICLPTSLHMGPANHLVENGLHVFMEKPISHDMIGVDDLIAEVRKRDLVMLVGYIFRWLPSLQKAKLLLDQGVIGDVLIVRSENSTYLPDWHPWEDYRSFYMSKKELGGGVLLDSSHTIDWCHWLFGEISSVYCVNDHISDLEIDSDDVATMIVTFASGAIGNIHLDMLGRHARKNLEVVGSKGTLLWDFATHEVSVFHGDEKRWEVFPVAVDFAACYVQELREFLDAINGSKLNNDLIDDGRHTMAVVEAARNSASTGSRVQVG